MNQKLTAGTAILLCFLALMPATTNATAWEAAPEELLFYIPAGTTQFVDARVDAPVIFIEGTLTHVGPGDLMLTADRIYLAPGSHVQARDGTSLTTRAADGANVVLSASQTIYIGGVVEAGDGADMLASDQVVGANGGTGGNVLLTAPAIQVYSGAGIAPGAGGKGADVHPTVLPADALVHGGNGGNAGVAIFQGTPNLPSGGNVLAAADGGSGGSATVTNATALLAQGGDGGDGAFFGTTDLSFLGQAPQGYTVFPTASNTDSNMEPPCVGSQVDIDCWRAAIIAAITIEDDENGCGDGADGAPATNAGTTGGNGGPGADGNPGIAGAAGGKGGDGNPGGYASATGGNGGNGRCWFSSGGDGGDGTGNGGTGGNGGKGGTGGAGTPLGGPGGNGGRCGSGGAATGVGGQGGQGGTFGSPGSPGMGYANPGAPGEGGAGGSGGAGQIPGPSGAGGACAA